MPQALQAPLNRTALYLMRLAWVLWIVALFLPAISARFEHGAESSLQIWSGSGCVIFWVLASFINLQLMLSAIYSPSDVSQDDFTFFKSVMTPWTGNLILFTTIWPLYYHKNLWIFMKWLIVGLFAAFLVLESWSLMWTAIFNEKSVPSILYFFTGINISRREAYQGPLIGYFVWFTSILLAASGLWLANRRGGSDSTAPSIPPNLPSVETPALPN